MKNRKIYIAYILIISIFFVYGPQTFASNDIEFKNIEVLDIEDGKATIKWFTTSSTKGVIYFGKSPDDLDRSIGYSRYERRHEVILSGLEKKKKYYYKIVAVDLAQNQKEAYIQSFSTKDMKRKELIKPIFLEQKVLQTTSNAVALFWKTNEETNAVISYWIDSAGINKAKKKVIKKYSIDHESFVLGLKAGKKYYLKIEAKDRSGNRSSKYFTVNTFNYNDKDLKLKISRIEPLSYDMNNIFSRRAVIDFRTNLVTKVYIKYGTTPGKYNKRSIISKLTSLDHQIVLSDLKPETTYYYRIVASKGLYNKSLTSGEMSFITTSLKGELRSGSLVKGSDYKVYVISGDKKRWIESADMFNKLGYKWDWIKQVHNAILGGYEDGKSIKTAKKHLDGTLVKYSNSYAVYLIDNGKIRPFSSAEAFVKNGYSWDRIITIPKREKYKMGEYL